MQTCWPLISLHVRVLRTQVRSKVSKTWPPRVPSHVSIQCHHTLIQKTKQELDTTFGEKAKRLKKKNSFPILLPSRLHLALQQRLSSHHVWDGRMLTVYDSKKHPEREMLRAIQNMGLSFHMWGCPASGPCLASDVVHGNIIAIAKATAPPQHFLPVRQDEAWIIAAFLASKNPVGKASSVECGAW